LLFIFWRGYNHKRDNQVNGSPGVPLTTNKKELCYMADYILTESSFFLNRFPHSRGLFPFDRTAEMLELVVQQFWRPFAGYSGKLLEKGRSAKIEVEKHSRMNLDVSGRKNQLMRQRRHGLGPDLPMAVGVWSFIGTRISYAITIRL
jgi:hypothetical protein